MKNKFTLDVTLSPADPSEADLPKRKSPLKKSARRYRSVIWSTKAEKEAAEAKARKLLGEKATFNDLVRFLLKWEPAKNGAPKGNKNAVGHIGTNDHMKKKSK